MIYHLFHFSHHTFYPTNLNVTVQMVGYVYFQYDFLSPDDVWREDKIQGEIFGYTQLSTTKVKQIKQVKEQNQRKCVHFF